MLRGNIGALATLWLLLAACSDPAGVEPAAQPGDQAGPDASSAKPDVPVLPDPGSAPDEGSVTDLGPDPGPPDVPAGDDGPAPDGGPVIHPELWEVGEVEKTCGNGLLARMKTGYGDVRVLRVQGSHAEMGYQYGCLLGQAIVDLWWTFMASLAAEEDAIGSPEEADAILGLGLDLAWDQSEREA